MQTDYKVLLEQLNKIKPIEYGFNRNYIDGDVTRLSPYISRGVLSTRQVLDSLIKRGFDLGKIEKMIQELAWRDYWQRVWQEKNIDIEIKHSQKDVIDYGVSESIVNANTGIEAIDLQINELYRTGYIHNHLRMYIASLSTNVAKNHWKVPAKWMYYHLLDGDWASNALSWQWVAGVNSNKNYIANQENINKYTHTNQKGSFLDVDYQKLSLISQPEELRDLSKFDFEITYPEFETFNINDGQSVCIYNYYNLDPNWRKESKYHRVLLIEPSIFGKYPIGEKAMNFMLSLARNIDDIKVFVGEFNQLPIGQSQVIFKEHPLNKNYKGIEDQREWMSSIKGYHSSFFSFWKKAKKEIFQKNA
jgi:deoxyribodipyrimidine photo-lyase